MKTRNPVRRQQQGFSLLEMLLVVGIMGIISGGILAQMDSAQQRGYSEQLKLDNFQEARDFVDQFVRDINQIGYPNSRLVDTTSLSWVPPLVPQTTYSWASPFLFEDRLAIGFVKIEANAVQFEGDMNGNGIVQSIIYKVNGSGSCRLCLQRSQVDKAYGDPLSLTTQLPNWGTEANDVLSDPIFTYFKADGTAIPNTSLPYDISTFTGAQVLASIKTIKISLTIRNNSVIDPKTSQPIETNFEGEVSINNCSMATTGRPESCQ